MKMKEERKNLIKEINRMINGRTAMHGGMFAIDVLLKMKGSLESDIKRDKKSIETLRLNDHDGRLNRQGRDIHILWNKVEKVTKENNKLIFVVRELLRKSGLEVKVEKNGEVRLEGNKKEHKKRLKNKMMENFFEEVGKVQRSESGIELTMEISERRIGRLAQMTLRDINEIR